MGRLACVDLPALPLQLLLRAHPEWQPRGQPVAVVDRDQPQGLIQSVNEAARRLGVLPGQRYGAALALASSLCAGCVEAGEVTAAVDEVTERLRRFTPDIEPLAGEPGTFLLDAGGLRHLYPSLAAWATAIRRDLARAGFAASIAVGFDRFAVYAVARAQPRGASVFDQPHDETAAMRRVPLDRLALEPAARDALARLAIRTLGDLLALPPAGLRRRFGAAVHRLHQLAAGDLVPPLQPAPPPEPLALQIDLDDPESDTASLTFRGKQLLHPLLSRLAARGEALSELTISLRLDHRAGEAAPVLDEVIRPAEPTLDALLLCGLIHLRLEGLRLPAGAVQIALRVDGRRASREQLRLFAERPRRDLAAADRAIARLRALFGDDAVVHAALRSGHLPEARYAWERLAKLPLAAPRTVTDPPLVRRLQARPIALPKRALFSGREPDGWMPLGHAAGAVARSHGPYVVSGAWWRREQRRDYYFVELQSGDVLWLYHDARRSGWFLHGTVE